jgi:nitrogen regulatory protein PII
MQAAKKIEVIINALEVRKVAAILEQHAVSGYSIISDVTGKGRRGTKAGDELTDVFKNGYIMTICTAEQAAAITNDLRSVVKRFGGICVVTDVQMLL